MNYIFCTCGLGEAREIRTPKTETNNFAIHLISFLLLESLLALFVGIIVYPLFSFEEFLDFYCKRGNLKKAGKKGGSFIQRLN